MFSGLPSYVATFSTCDLFLFVYVFTPSYIRLYEDGEPFNKFNTIIYQIMFKALFIFIILYLFLFDVILLAFKYKFEELYFTQYFYVSELNHTVPAFNTNISFEKYMTYQALSRYVATPKCMQYLSLV